MNWGLPPLPACSLSWHSWIRCWAQGRNAASNNSFKPTHLRYTNGGTEKRATVCSATVCGLTQVLGVAPSNIAICTKARVTAALLARQELVGHALNLAAVGLLRECEGVCDLVGAGSAKRRKREASGSGVGKKAKLAPVVGSCAGRMACSLQRARCRAVGVA